MVQWWGRFLGSMTIVLGGLTGCGVAVDDNGGALSGGSSPGSGTPAEGSTGSFDDTGDSSESTGSIDETSDDAGGVDSAGEDEGGSDTGTVDCGEGAVAYRDQDGDGYGDPDQPTPQCPPPAGHVLNFDDCDDGNEAINPEAEETCDQVDQDCDGLVDEVSPANTTCGGCELRDIMGRPFWFCSSGQSFNGAEAICTAKGAHLASINTIMEQQTARSHASGISGADWWIGLSDATSEGAFAWLDGSPVTYTNWEPGEPNDHGSGEDCGEMKVSDNGIWNDVPCGESKPFMCSVAPAQ